MVRRGLPAGSTGWVTAAAICALASCSRRTTASAEPATVLAPDADVAVESHAVAPAPEPAPEPVSPEPAPPPRATDSTVEGCPGIAAPIPTKVRAACDPARAIERVHVLHTSDLHGHWHSYLQGRSPFAIVRAYGDRRRAETGGRVIQVDAGDALEKGALAEVRSRGDATVHLLDRLGLDVRTLGNHDFAWGSESVARQAASTAHQVLASNLTPLGDTTFAAKRSVVVEIGCARVGFFGLVVNPYDETDERFEGSYLGAFAHAHDPGEDRYVGLATTLVRELREEQKVDVVIALDHLGLIRDRALIDAVPGLDLVVSGHDHVAVSGPVQGRYGALVASGSFLTGARIGEVVLDVDARAHTAKLVSATSSRIEELRDLDASVQGEVERLQACFAPDAERPLGDLTTPLASFRPDLWTPIMDAALRARFPEGTAFLYEAWTQGGLVKTELARGPVSAQQLADLFFSERQKAGGPGFTAFETIPVSAATLREICASPLRDGGPDKRMHRVCPEVVGDAVPHALVVERRPLHAPQLAFLVTPKSWPVPPADESRAVEAMDVMIAWATARGQACRAIDRDVVAPCR